MKDTRDESKLARESTIRQEERLSSISTSEASASILSSIVGLSGMARRDALGLALNRLSMFILSAMKLTEHFSLEEPTHSDIAIARGIDNTPPPEVVANLERLAPFLEVVRAILGHHPMQISSGFRCEALNEAVHGVSNSAHLFGLAADFVCPGAGSSLSICARLRGSPGLEFDQLINECDSRGNRWVHIGIAAPGAPPRGLRVLAVLRESARSLDNYRVGFRCFSMT